MLSCKSLPGMLIAASLALGCGDDESPGDGGSPADAGMAADDPTDPALYDAPSGEELAFGVRDGDIRNYFHRQGPSSVHLLTRSGRDPRIVAAFPAENQGIGVWFLDPGKGVELWAGDAEESDLAAGGGLVAVVREQEDELPMAGVRATLRSDATRLTSYLTLLANVRTLRDYGYGLCLENAAQLPELRNEKVELIEEHGVVRIRREQIGGEHAMELLLKGRAGTTLSVREEEVPPRSDCQAGAGDRAETVIEIAGEAGIEVEIIALSDDEPLTPIELDDLLVERPPDSLELDALAFLSYAEKLEAGSWRFLTYFGRDTLLSVRMLMPGLKSEVVAAALTAVVERINLKKGVPDPSFDYVIEVGDVAHEEELGDFAAWKNSMDDPAPADLRQLRLDYKMVDDDFLLAPVLVEFFDKLTAEDPDSADAAVAAFLARTRADGRTFQQAIEANLALVLARARPFADDPAGPAAKRDKLIELKETVPVGQWRDSDMGIGYGRRAFDVNAALVPGALEAAAALYARLGQDDQAGEAERMFGEWQGVEEVFRVELPLAEARANAADYAEAVGVIDTSDQIEAEAGGMVRYYGISLDEAGDPIPVMHTDHGFVMEFTEPSEEYLVRVATMISRDFPAGLMSPVGVMVASPALAAAGETVVNPGDLRDPDDDAPVALRDIFTSSHYHGTVVWSWQQALLASGIRRQIEREDITEGTRSALEQAECKLWASIDAAEEVRAGELWSWAPDSLGQFEYRAFGFNRDDVDESNAIQLWSTVYLVVREPSPEANPVCVGPAP
jgi:hypothetical protein